MTMTAADATATVFVRDVFKVYKEGPIETVALRGVTLTVPRGDYVALCGPSGCGKTTLLNLIAALAVPTAGRVEIEGRDVGALTEAERSAMRRGTLGVVFQSDNLFPTLTAAENVELPLRLAGAGDVRTRAAALLELVGLSARARGYPAQLSGGERQRVAIAAALALAPRLLLADEITGELDSRNAGVVLDLLDRLNQEQGLTIIAVTHNPEAAARARHITRMLDGRVFTEEVAI